MSDQAFVRKSFSAQQARDAAGRWKQRMDEKDPLYGYQPRPDVQFSRSERWVTGPRGRPKEDHKEFVYRARIKQKRDNKRALIGGGAIGGAAYAGALGASIATRGRVKAGTPGKVSHFVMDSAKTSYKVGYMASMKAAAKTKPGNFERVFNQMSPNYHGSKAFLASNAASDAPPLWRGVKLPKNHPGYKVGDVIDRGLASFTDTESVARNFASMAGGGNQTTMRRAARSKTKLDGQSAFFHLPEGSQAVKIGGGEGEWLVNGKMRVKSKQGNSYVLEPFGKSMDEARRMVRDRSGRWMGAQVDGFGMVQSDIPIDSGDVSKARASNKEIEEKDPNAWRTIKQSEGLAAQERRKKTSSQGSAFISGGAGAIGLGYGGGKSLSRLASGVQRDHASLKHFAANGDKKGAKKAVAFARGIGRSARYRGARSPLGVGILGAGTAALGFNTAAAVHQHRSDQHTARANARRKQYHDSRKVAKADLRGEKREREDKARLTAGGGAAGLGGYVAGNGLNNYIKGKHMVAREDKLMATLKGGPLEGLGHRISGPGRALGQHHIKTGKKGLLMGAGVIAGGAATSIPAGFRLDKYSDRKVKKGMPDMADAHVQGVLRPIKRVSRGKVEKGFGSAPDNPYGRGISMGERGKRAGKNGAANLTGTAGVLAGGYGGVKAFNRLGGGKKGAAAALGTFGAGSAAGMLGAKKIGDKLYPGTQQGAFGRKSVAKAFERGNKRATAGYGAGALVGLPGAGLAIGAGSSARQGKGFKVGAKSVGRGALEGTAGSALGAVAGARLGGGTGMRAGGLAGGLAGSLHGGNASVNTSRRKGYLKPGF